MFGLDAFRDAIARGIALAEHAEATLRARAGWEIVSPASLAIVTFRRTGADDEQTDAMVRSAVADGFAAPSTTVLERPHRRAAVHDQSAHHKSGHTSARSSASSGLSAETSQHPRHCRVVSDLRRSARGVKEEGRRELVKT